jgi:hypothetical protein
MFCLSHRTITEQEDERTNQKKKGPYAISHDEYHNWGPAPAGFDGCCKSNEYQGEEQEMIEYRGAAGVRVR